MNPDTDHGQAARSGPAAVAGRSAHLPIDEALAPFADALRQHLPTPDEIEQAAARRAQLRRPRLRGSGAVAGAVLLALWWADPALQRQTLSSAVGERRDWQLADGTRVMLNTDSRVEVAQHLRSRRLVLAQGEASFDVAHAFWHGWAPWLQRTLTVRAGDVVVQDIGTVFGVHRRADGADVTVLSGRVRVHDGHGASVELGSGQRVRAGGMTMDAALPLQPVSSGVSADDAMAWREGRLVFDGTPLSDAVAQMQRYRRAPIALADAQAAQWRISGQFDLARIDQLLDLLPRLAPVVVRREEDGRVVIGTRQPS